MNVSHRRRLTWAALFLATSIAVSDAQAPLSPTGLSSQVSGDLVTISWNPAAGAAAYAVLVGSAPGASDLFAGSVGAATSASGRVPPGTYFWRVVALSIAGEPSAPSGEAQFTVGGAAGCTPVAPGGLTADVSGARVTLRWSAPAGAPPATYVIEAGSGAGLANLHNGVTGSAATEVAVDAVPMGTYFVRIRAQHACGTSAPSNEVVVQVGPGATPGGNCSYALASDTSSAASAGATIQVSVVAPPGCRWRLASDLWIVPASNPSGSGPATLAYVVMPNGGSPRSGRIVPEALDPGPVTQEVIIAQAGGIGCAYTVEPPVLSVIPNGGSVQASISTNAGCGWTASSQAPFIAISSGAQGTGPGVLRIEVAANPEGVARSGSVRVSWPGGSQDLVVSQSAIGPLVARFTVTPDPCPIVDSPSNPMGSTVAYCAFDASSSTSGVEITSYEWSGIFHGTGAVLPVGSLNTGCGFGSGTFQRTLVLTVRDALGRVQSLSRDVTFRKDSGC